MLNTVKNKVKNNLMISMKFIKVLQKPDKASSSFRIGSLVIFQILNIKEIII